jgi:acetaldehyde dehydrogenase (acetylating)
MENDLESIQEARNLCERSHKAQITLAEFSQEKIDSIVKAMEEAALSNAETLAEQAIDETKLGILEDKISKNRFAAENVYDYIKDIKTVGIIKEYPQRKVYEIAEPMGPIVGIIPMTNPTSTIIFKALIAVKSRNTIVFSPHPRAVKCSLKTTEILNEAVKKSGAPENTIQCLSKVTIKGTDELMKHPYTGLILATGGSAMVTSAYSSGKPAIGVGPGNVPAFLEKSCDIKDAVTKIVKSKTFDKGTVCSSEQSVVCEESIDTEVKEEFKKKGAYFLSDEEKNSVEKVLFTSKGLPDPDIVGQSAQTIAKKAGFSVSDNVRLLIAEMDRVGEEFPLSKEKISPILSYYTAADWEKGCLRCIEILKLGGIGHTLVIHSKNEDIIKEFALKKPAFRILVNTPSSQGAIGLSTGLTPSLTLGCGTWGGGITSDNVSPLHLINIKRLAYDIQSSQTPETSTEEVLEKREPEQIEKPEPHLTDENIEKILREFIAERKKKGYK